MGLDTVEIVMSVEEEFGIKIPDCDAEKLQTVGGLHDYIFAKLCEREGRGNVVDASVWTRLVDIVVEKLGVDRSRIQPEAHFIYDLGAD